MDVYGLSLELLITSSIVTELLAHVMSSSLNLMSVDLGNIGNESSTFRPHDTFTYVYVYIYI